MCLLRQFPRRLDNESHGGLVASALLHAPKGCRGGMAGKWDKSGNRGDARIARGRRKLERSVSKVELHLCILREKVGGGGYKKLDSYKTTLGNVATL